MLVIIGVIHLFDLLPIQTHQKISDMSPLQNTIIDITLLSLSSGVLAWLLSIPMLLKISKQQTKNATQNKENKYLNYALNTHSLVYCVNKKGIITYVNNQLCLTSGYEEKELLGKSYNILNSNYHKTAVVSDIWDTMAQVQTWNGEQGQTWQGEQDHTDKQSCIYWLDSTVVSMLDSSGKDEEYLVLSRNITTAKKNEIQMLSLKRALDASTEMVVVTDENNFIQYHNSAVNDITGWKKEELKGQQLSIFNSPNCDIEVLNEMKKCLLDGQSWSGRILSRRKGMAPINIAGQATPPDTRDYWVNMNITPIRDGDNTYMGCIQIQRDITIRMQSEFAQEMEKSDTAARISIANVLQKTIPIKERMTQILKIIFELEGFNLQRKGGIFLKNPEQDFLDMYLLQGQFSFEFIRREQHIPFGACLCGRAAITQELIVSDDCFCDPRHEHHFDGMKPHGHYIIPIVSADITLGILFLYTDTYPNANESRLIMLQQIGDMLALALLQEQVTKSMELARDNAEQTARAKTDFLANMSHEIRTPMNGVLGMLDILKDTALNDEQYDLLGVASDSADSLLVIINDILDFSKLEAGKVELENIEFNLPNLVEEVCTLMSKTAHAKQLELNCFLPPDIQKIWLGDPTRVRQILTNLIGNAIKFTETGEVSINLKVDSLKDNKRKGLLFKINDTGIGISPEVQPLLFQPFSQADNSTARRFGGTGLGLSISKTLVYSMEGEIGVDSVPDQGSCFWFTLPLQASTKNNGSVSDFDFSGKKALIVDDNQTNRKILIHYLQHWGMKTKAVSNVPEALLSLETAVNKNEGFDIILSDLQMPDMDGFALAQQIIKTPSIALTPRLLLSSGGMPAKQKLLELGFAQSLLKPIRQPQLFNAIAVALSYEVAKINRETESNEVLPHFSHKKILVVEDNKINQKVIMGMLKRFHITPDLEDNGQKALDRLAHNHYDLVLMDCQMPILDGYEATRQLRIEELDKKVPRAPVVALTAHAATDERDKCLAAGMDDYLTKPLSRSALEKILISWLGDPVMVKEEPDPEAMSPHDKNSESCWDKSAALDLIGNDLELLNDMIDLFITGISDLLLELDHALEQNNLSQLADSAHTIKGIAGQLCAEKMTALASNIELNARQQSPADYENLIKEITQASTKLTSELQQLQNS
ncbi:MAG: response regulator [Methylococcales bacterium]|nr:response regulator [Methylococcales bacterium]